MQKQQNLKNLQELKQMVCPRTIEEQFAELYALIAQTNETVERSQVVDMSQNIQCFESIFLKTEIFKRSSKIVKIRYRVNIAIDYCQYTTLYLLSNDKVFILDGNEAMKEGLYLDIDEAIEIYSGNLRTIL